jgi:hypothetical protein
MSSRPGRGVAGSPAMGTLGARVRVRMEQRPYLFNPGGLSYSGFVLSKSRNHCQAGLQGFKESILYCSAEIFKIMDIKVIHITRIILS